MILVQHMVKSIIMYIKNIGINILEFSAMIDNS